MKLPQQLCKLLEEGETSKVLSLQSKVKAAYPNYLDAVQEFCGSLEKDSKQYKRYMDQLQVQVLPVTLVNPSSDIARMTWALLDSKADTHLLSRRLFTELGFRGTPIRTKLQLANGDTKVFNTHETSCIIEDLDGAYSFHLDVVRVVDRLSNLKGSIPSPTDLLPHDYLSDIQFPDLGESNVELIVGMSTPELHVFSDICQGEVT